MGDNPAYPPGTTLFYGSRPHYEANAVDLDQFQIEETSCTDAWAKQNMDLATRYLKEITACISSVTGIIPQIEKQNTIARTSG